jgi:iron complex outermembrane receptor protein
MMSLKKMSMEELMDIEVTSVSRHAEKLLDAASAIQVITSNDIRRSGASSLPEALRLADNLNVAQKNPHDWGISARGFNTELANKLLVMIDGRTVYTPLFSGVFWHLQDYLLEDVDRIEVISGPGGALWGANAVNGVINVTTKSAKDTPGGFAEAGVGNELEQFGALRYGGTLAPKVYYRVYATAFERDNGVFRDGATASNAWKMQRGGFRVDAERGEQTTMTLQGDLYGGREKVATGGEMEVSGGNVLGRWSRRWSDDTDVRVQVYFDRTHLEDPMPKSAFAPAGMLTDDLDTYDVDFQNGFRLGERNRVVWGLGFRRTKDTVVNAPATGFRPNRLTQDLFSGFVQDRLSLTKTLSVTLGTKVEHNDYTGRETEPSGRVQWNFAENQMAWAAVSRAVRTPSRIDRDFFQPTNLPAGLPQNLIMGSPSFVSETVVAYEAGYRTQIGKHASAAASFFYNRYDHVRSTGTTLPTILPLVFQNNLEGETHGVELSATWQVTDHWRLRGGATLLREHLRVKPGKTDINKALNETADPEQQFSLRSSLDLAKGVEFDAGFRWVDELRINDSTVPGTVPSYAELDARLGWQISPALELSLVGQNLLHDHHAEFGRPLPTREEIQRSFYVKATWRF